VAVADEYKITTASTVTRPGSHQDIISTSALARTLNPGYAVAEVIEQLRHAEDALRAAAEEVPALPQQVDAKLPVLAVGVEFWRALLDADRRLVLADVPCGC
jgi:hypothetical protein